MPKKFVYIEGFTKKYEVLKEAMKYLDVKSHSHPKDKYEFICHCINCAVNDNALCFVDKSGLIQIIEDRLDGHDTFNMYLHNKHTISVEKQEQDDGRKLQYTRKLWMQSMYEEFKSKDE